MNTHRGITLLLVLLILLISRVHAAVAYDVYLKYDWYHVELLVFQQRANTDFNANLSEALVYRSSRSYPAIVNSFALTQADADVLFLPDEHISFASSEGMFLNSYPAEFVSLNPSSLEPPVASEMPSAPAGCAFHRTSIVSSESDSSSDGFSQSSIESETQDDDSETPRLDNSGQIVAPQEPSTPRTRNARLPHWLPDEWQTFETTLADAMRALFLCEEDYLSIIASQSLDDQALHPAEQSGNEVEQISVSVTPAEVETRFASYESELLKTERVWDEQDIRLTNTNRRLRNEGYRIIGHGKWHQRIPPRGEQIPIVIQLGALRADGLRELEGSVEISAGRFLHVQLRIWFAVDEYDQTTSLRNKWVVNDSNLAYYELDESRRMRSGEYHYVDHPKIGVFVRIDPMSLSDEMQHLVDELNENF